METYVISLLFVASFSVYMIRAWFNSTLSAQILNVFVPKENKLYTKEDADNYLLQKPFFIYSLLTCPICMAFHLSLWATLFVFIGRNIFNSGSMDVFEALAVLFISATISSYFGDTKENREETLVEKKEEPLAEKKEESPKVDKPEVNETQKKSGLKFVPTPESTREEKTVQDFGGFLLETDAEGKRSVIGTTKIYSDYVTRVFDESLDCNFPKCYEWRNKYNAELAALEEKYAKDDKACPECIKSGVKRRFYDTIKAELESLRTNGHPRPISRP